MPLGKNDPVYLEGKVAWLPGIFYLKLTRNSNLAKNRFQNGWKSSSKSYKLDSIYYIVWDGNDAQSNLAANRAYL
jgi:hypothetical protein